MKAKFIIGMFFGILTPALFSCKPDPQVLNQAREEAMKEGYSKGYEQGIAMGYDSAMAIALDTSKFVHPPYDGHIHTKRKGPLPATGTMFRTSRLDHKPESYVDFYDPNGFIYSRQQTEPEKKDHTWHVKYKIMWVNKYNSRGKVVARTPLAIELKPVKAIQK